MSNNKFDMNSATNNDVEVHPWPPYIPAHARVLIMGTFPPQPKRWAMDFYYPNRTNDFWKIMGMIFLGNRFALYNPDERSYNVTAIKKLLNSEGIALNDTGKVVRRLRDNASDKFLEILKPVDLESLLHAMPDCCNVATTGEKAAGVIAQLAESVPPSMGKFVEIPNFCGRTLRHWRMPSTSRAYPLAIEKKAEYYSMLFKNL